MGRKITAVILSVLLLCGGWLGSTGLTLLVALVPLLWLSEQYDASRRAWWRCCGWAALTFLLWNVSTVWWVGFATPVGPVAATIVSTLLNLIAFMGYHTIRTRAPRALAYTYLVAAWIATEYWYTVGDVSWPWLLLGNGFSHDVWAVQWYEYTGIFGGSLWVLLSNLCIYEAIRRTTRAAIVRAAASVLLPMAVSLTILFTWRAPEGESVKVTVVQPNIDCYDKFKVGTAADQEALLLRLAAEAPADADFIVLPETALPGYHDERTIERQPAVRRIARSLREKGSGAVVVVGTNLLRHYGEFPATATARWSENRRWYDAYNAVIGVDSSGRVQIHRKAQLVIGVEKTPLPWLFNTLKFLTIDLGGLTGQLGVGEAGPNFTKDDAMVGTAICYEGLYGAYYGEFVQQGAQAMLISSNDGWWRDTPGHRHLFTLSRLRAIEHRRAIARSANTGTSGFIDARGRILQRMGWDERGVMTDTLLLDDRQTIYTRYGDYIARVAEYLLLLTVLYFIAYRVRRRNHLVE